MTAKRRFGFPPWSLIVIITVWVAAVFARTVSFPLDRESSALIQASATNELLYAKSVIPQYFRPLWMLSLRLDAWTFGLTGAKGFHLVNIGLHTACVMLAFWLVLEISNSRLLASLTAWIWSVFPAAGFVVSWVAQRNDSLATLFVLASAILLLRSLRRRSGPLLVLSIAAYGLAICAKEIAFFFPLSMLGYLLFPGSNRAHKLRLASYLGSCMVILALFLIWRTHCAGGLPVDQIFREHMQVYGGNCFALLLRYSLNLPLSFLQCFFPLELIGSTVGAVSIVVGLVVILVSSRMARSSDKPGPIGVSYPGRRNIALFGIAIMSASVVPLVCGFEARVLYLPSFGASLVLAANVEGAIMSYPKPLSMLALAGFVILGGGYCHTASRIANLFSPECWQPAGLMDLYDRRGGSCTIRGRFRDTIDNTRRLLGSELREFFQNQY